MGCHFEYRKRYPVDSTYFKLDSPVTTEVNSDRARALVNAYDISEIMTVFDKYSMGRNTALIFLSDHGEELFEYRDFCGHTYPPGKTMGEIPYFVYLCERYRENYRVISENVARRRHTR